MSENISKHGPDSSESDSSHSHDFWNIHEGDGLKHCIKGLCEAFYIGLAFVMLWGGAHYYRDGKTENNKKGKMEIDAGQTQMYPQAPRHEDFFERKFME